MRQPGLEADLAGWRKSWPEIQSQPRIRSSLTQAPISIGETDIEPPEQLKKLR